MEKISSVLLIAIAVAACSPSQKPSVRADTQASPSTLVASPEVLEFCVDRYRSRRGFEQTKWGMTFQEVSRLYPKAKPCLSSQIDEVASWHARNGLPSCLLSVYSLEIRGRESHTDFSFWDNKLVGVYVGLLNLDEKVFHQVCEAQVEYLNSTHGTALACLEHEEQVGEELEKFWMDDDTIAQLSCSSWRPNSDERHQSEPLAPSPSISLYYQSRVYHELVGLKTLSKHEGRQNPGMCLAGKLFWAIEKNELDKVRDLTENHCDVDTVDRNNSTGLHVASQFGNRAIAEYLLAAGASVDAVDDQGFRPIRKATFFCHRDIVELLLRHGADAMEIDGQGETLLHEAARARCLPLVDTFLKLGLDPQKKNHSGDTACKIARDWGWKEVSDRLCTRSD